MERTPVKEQMRRGKNGPPVKERAPRRIYLDNNAGAPLHPKAVCAMTEAMAQTGNPSSLHREGRAAWRVLADARASLGALLGFSNEEAGRAKEEGIFFTSGATEANNIVLASFRARRVPILVSAGEHPSVMNAAGSDRWILPLDGQGRVDLDRMDEALAGLPANTPRALVAVMAANNETGVLSPMRSVSEIVHRHGALLLTDATQWVGRLPFAASECGADFIILSGHKSGGPVGVGALLAHGRAVGELTPFMQGGGQEAGLRPGTENIPGICGFVAGLARALSSVHDEGVRLAGLRDRLEAGLREIAPELVIFGEDAQRLPNSSCFALPGWRAETQIIALDLAGAAVGSGSACSGGNAGASASLRAMGTPASLADCAIRASLGWANGEACITRFLALWHELFARRQRIEQARQAA